MRHRRHESDESGRTPSFRFFERCREDGQRRIPFIWIVVVGVVIWALIGELAYVFYF